MSSSHSCCCIDSGLHGFKHAALALLPCFANALCHHRQASCECMVQAVLAIYDLVPKPNLTDRMTGNLRKAMGMGAREAKEPETTKRYSQNLKSDMQLHTQLLCWCSLRCICGVRIHQAHIVSCFLALNVITHSSRQCQCRRVSGTLVQAEQQCGVPS